MDNEIAMRFIAAHIRMNGGKPENMTVQDMLDCFAILPPPSKSLDEFHAAVDIKEGQRQALEGLKGIEGVTISGDGDGSSS